MYIISFFIDDIFKLNYLSDKSDFTIEELQRFADHHIVLGEWPDHEINSIKVTKLTENLLDYINFKYEPAYKYKSNKRQRK